MELGQEIERNLWSKQVPMEVAGNFQIVELKIPSFYEFSDDAASFEYNLGCSTIEHANAGFD